jgi:hypothetical protein
MWEEKLKVYDELVAKCPRFERKGKTVPYNSIMHGYVLIPEKMLEDLDDVARYLNESYDYVMSLEPK